MTAAIETDVLLPHPPARVWHALTDAATLGRWLMPTTFSPMVGAAFTFDTGQWGLVQCTVLEMEPERTLRISWSNLPLDTTVTWLLEPEGAGTRLRLSHAGFDLDDPRQRFAHEGMSHGWRGMVTVRLERVLAELE